MNTEAIKETDHVSWWKPVLFAALAGGMGWGIRGQYGHETGAMNAGVMVSLVLAYLLCGKLNTTTLVRGVAMGTVAMGIGGSMTYGQTVGLTHNGNVVGNADALRWGLLGLSIKGGIWIGFCGAFLGMGMSGYRYRSGHILALMLAVLGAFLIGTRLLNYPFNPGGKELPYLYFSDAWQWHDTEDIKPRREVWGGLLLALGTVIVYAGWWAKDTLGRNMGLWGFLGGAIGFPTGQCIQAYHAWNHETFTVGIWEKLGPLTNWWNMMETTFGAIMGGVLGLGLWLNRKKIGRLADMEPDRPIPYLVEIVLLAIHCTLLFYVEFRAVRQIDVLYDLGLIMAIIPFVAVVGGRLWPYLVIFPITLMPIAGKTVRQLIYRESGADGVLNAADPSLSFGRAIVEYPLWFPYFIVPMAISLAATMIFFARHRSRSSDPHFAGIGLLITGWTFFLLNWAFFQYPWPWAEWTSRTPNGIIFTICIFSLTGMVAARFIPRSNSPHSV
ncbi:MAG TPA: hypothetical protein EYN96_01425 [Candidatus Hydrogenedentes bacterium]|nr:hypothetical protein [Candidatus Hydrogenedentota bacterium]